MAGLSRAPDATADAAADVFVHMLGLFVLDSGHFDQNRGDMSPAQRIGSAGSPETGSSEPAQPAITGRMKPTTRKKSSFAVA
jgi:hypothetical protein